MRRIKKIIKFILGIKPIKEGTPYEYINWLTYANAGMLHKGNIYCIEYAIKNLPSSNSVIEIGSFCGLSTNLIAFYLQKYKKSNYLITMDKWIFENGENQNEYLEGSSITNKEYKEFVKNSYIRNISFFSNKHLPYTIEQFSDDFFEMWSNKKEVNDVLNRPIQLGGKIAFAYIDGNHKYSFAKRDFENVDNFLEIGGYILFDDSADNSNWEVKKVIKEVKASGRYEIVIKNPNYLFKKIK